MSAHLDNTYGAAFIGMVIAAALYGASCIQTLYYFTNQNDSWFIKLTVIAVMVLDTFNQISMTHLAYTYTVTYWGNAEQPLVVWSLGTAVVSTGMTAFVVQSFLTMRIWRLSGRNIYLTISSLLLTEDGIGSWQLYAGLKDLPSLTKIKHEAIAINVLGAAIDLIIAAMLCTLLHLSRTAFRKSNTIINKLIIFSVNTGLITSLCALASMISILVAGNTFIYIAFFFCLGRLYTNSLLSTLNLREVIRRGSHSEGSSLDTMSFSVQNVPKMESTQSESISFKIDTNTSKYHSHNHQKLHEELSGDTLRFQSQWPIIIKLW
ncbi:hypothetical protein BYT27DRAFT_7246559 [Phlegmacium glaucopus]|nr:hypothetical protein BYT27DRAFT_7246559 [Phlegmacium glaucopus]